MDDARLIQKLAQSEDGWVERKESLDDGEVRRTIVAFANSLPEGSEPAILFLGASNNGRHPGLSDADGLQKKVRPQAENHSYPAITIQMKVFSVEVEGKGKEILAVIVPPSPNKPHFAGVAYMRKGSETFRASDVAFKELIASQNEKARRLLQWKDRRVLLQTRSQTGLHIEYESAIIRNVDAHSLTIDTGEGWGQTYATDSAEILHLFAETLRVIVPTKETEQQLIRRMIERWLFAHHTFQGNNIPNDRVRYLTDQLLENIRLSWDMMRFLLSTNSSPAGTLLLRQAVDRAKAIGLVR